MINDEDEAIINKFEKLLNFYSKSEDYELL